MDAVVTDAPYGVQHGSRSHGRAPLHAEPARPAARGRAGLGRRAPPRRRHGHRLEHPRGRAGRRAGRARRRRPRAPRRRPRTAAFEHRVDQAIQRDVLVARRTRFRLSAWRWTAHGPRSAADLRPGPPQGRGDPARGRGRRAASTSTSSTSGSRRPTPRGPTPTWSRSPSTCRPRRQRYPPAPRAAAAPAGRAGPARSVTSRSWGSSSARASGSCRRTHTAFAFMGGVTSTCGSATFAEPRGHHHGQRDHGGPRSR